MEDVPFKQRNTAKDEVPLIVIEDGARIVKVKDIHTKKAAEWDRPSQRTAQRQPSQPRE